MGRISYPSHVLFTLINTSFVSEKKKKNILRFGHMRRVMSMVLFKGFLVWCVLSSHMIWSLVLLLSQFNLLM